MNGFDSVHVRTTSYKQKHFSTVNSSSSNSIYLISKQNEYFQKETNSDESLVSSTTEDDIQEVLTMSMRVSGGGGGGGSGSKTDKIIKELAQVQMSCTDEGIAKLFRRQIRSLITIMNLTIKTFEDRN